MTTASHDPRIYYDQFSRHYDTRRRGGYHGLIDDLEAGFVVGVEDGLCLEAGCGTGLILDRLAPRFRRVVGVDLSEGMLRHAINRGHACACGSVAALPFGTHQFDVVCSFKVLAHVEPIRETLLELARVTKPGGLMVLEFYNRKSLRGLRWRAKTLVGGEKVGAGTRETELYTRYDDVSRILEYLPSGTAIEGVYGSIIVTPLAWFFGIPVVGPLLARVERALSRSRWAKYSGFVTVVARREFPPPSAGRDSLSCG